LEKEKPRGKKIGGGRLQQSHPEKKKKKNP